MNSPARLASWKRYRDKNKEKRQEQRKEWAKKNPEKMQHYAQMDYLKHTDAYKERAKKSSEARKSVDPEIFLEMNRMSKRRAKMQLFKLLGGRCCKCGFSDDRALQVDHIDAQPLPRATGLRGGEKLYRAILNGAFPLSDFQLLCANCNSIKRFENGEGCRVRTEPLPEHIPSRRKGWWKTPEQKAEAAKLRWEVRRYLYGPSGRRSVESNAQKVDSTSC